MNITIGSIFYYNYRKLHVYQSKVTHFLEIGYELMFVVYTTENDTNVQIYSLSK